MFRNGFKRLVTLAALIAALGLGGALSTTVKADAPVWSSSAVYTWPPIIVPVSGASSTLARTDQGITMHIKTSGLDAGAAYTAWWVVFNEPTLCSAPGCGEDDVYPGAPAQTSVLWAAGQVVNQQGTANFSAHLQEGNPIGEVLFGPGLVDTRAAEVHLVLRTHGSAIPGLVDDQIHTFMGGCGINVCADHQFAIHFP